MNMEDMQWNSVWSTKIDESKLFQCENIPNYYVSGTVWQIIWYQHQQTSFRFWLHHIWSLLLPFKRDNFMSIRVENNETRTEIRIKWNKCLKTELNTSELCMRIRRGYSAWTKLLNNHDSESYQNKHIIEKSIIRNRIKEN